MAQVALRPFMPRIARLGGRGRRQLVIDTDPRMNINER